MAGYVETAVEKIVSDLLSGSDMELVDVVSAGFRGQASRYEY